MNQCEGWLQLIKEKYSKLLDEPEYWECRAAIEESRGDIGSAVECYRTAIVQGAGVRNDPLISIMVLSIQAFCVFNELYEIPIFVFQH